MFSQRGITQFAGYLHFWRAACSWAQRNPVINNIAANEPHRPPLWSFHPKFINIVLFIWMWSWDVGNCRATPAHPWQMRHEYKLLCLRRLNDRQRCSSWSESVEEMWTEQVWGIEMCAMNLNYLIYQLSPVSSYIYCSSDASHCTCSRTEYECKSTEKIPRDYYS